MNVSDRLRVHAGSVLTTTDRVLVEAADEIDRLRAELAEYKRDAERYRWLLTGENQVEIFGCMWNRLGEAIETAMSEGEKNGDA